MSFAPNKFQRNHRILQESSKLNRPVPEKKNTLKTRRDGTIIKKPAVTPLETNVGEQSILSLQGSSSIASLSSTTEAILKRSLKNVPRAALPVRQTLTSKLRQMKANPLLPPPPTPAPLSASTPLQSSRPVPPLRSTSKPSRLSTLSRPPAAVSSSTKRLQKENKRPVGPGKSMPPPPPPSVAKKTLLNRKLPPVPRQVPQKPLTKPPVAGNTSGKVSALSSSKDPKRTISTARNPVVEPRVTPKKPAAIHPLTPQPKSILRRRSKSADNVNVADGSCDRAGRTPGIASKSMNKSMKSVAFYSPLNTAFPSPRITNTPPPSVLRKRLEDWLKKRGKTNYSYHHLCCFGLSAKAAEAPKLEVESPLDETITLEESSPDMEVPTVEEGEDPLCAPQGSSTPEKPEMVVEDGNVGASCRMVHPGALRDLQQLIHSGYPRDQCEEWLALIVRSHPVAKEEFLYWECLAALEEARGDLGGAVDCLGRAIEQGADAAAVDARLDALWERFCALGAATQPPTPNTRRRHTLDPKHIFKSTVIRFALQRKAAATTGGRRRSGGDTDASKDEDQQGQQRRGNRVRYVVTPVRRSARLSASASAFRSSQGLPCVASLKDLSPSMQKDVSFQGNALLDPNA